MIVDGMMEVGAKYQGIERVRVALAIILSIIPMQAGTSIAVRAGGMTVKNAVVREIRRVQEAVVTNFRLLCKTMF